MRNKVLVVQGDNCTGCRMCELACSSTKEGIFIPNRSRIRIITNGLEGWSRPAVCVQCEEPACLEACPVGAIYKKETSQGDMIIDINLKECTGCKQCVEACPFGVISIIKDTEVIKCDLCGGIPKCINFCSYKCLHFVELSEVEFQERANNIRELVARTRQERIQYDPHHRRTEFSQEITRLVSISKENLKKTRSK